MRAAPAPPAPAAVGNQLVAANLGWPVVFGLLNVAYYVLHYMFASQVGSTCLPAALLAGAACRTRRALLCLPADLAAPTPPEQRLQPRPRGVRQRDAFGAAPGLPTAKCGQRPTPPNPPPNTSTQTAHVGALYSAFLAMMIATGVPPVIAALSLGFMSNLFGSITHFGSGQAAVYYGAGA